VQRMGVILVSFVGNQVFLEGAMRAANVRVHEGQKEPNAQRIACGNQKT
jgi:hypothetical protein